MTHLKNTPQKIKKARKMIYQKAISGFVLVNLVLTLITPGILYPLPAHAIPVTETTGFTVITNAIKKLFIAQKETTVAVEEDVTAVKADTAADEAREAARKVEEERKDVQRGAIYVALTESLDQFVQTLSYDVATWLASGGEGQQPMFETEGWGAYLGDLADGAAGNFVERLGQEWDFNVCNPSASIKIKIGLGLTQISRPQRPNCTLTDIVGNFESIANDPNFLDRFSVVFDPTQNDFGIAVSLFGNYFEGTSDAASEGLLSRLASTFKDVTSPISNLIKTPRELVEKRAASLTEDSSLLEVAKVDYGNIALNAIDTFVNTLAGQLFQRLFKEGLADDGSNGSSGSRFGNARDLLRGLRLPGQGSNDGLIFDDTTSAGFSNRQIAQDRFSVFTNIGTQNAEQYDVLARLIFCPDPTNPGPEECVITPQFRTAIDQRLTVKEAIDRGFLDGDAPFGSFNFDSKSIYDGMPYRSIVVLRTHRIVPVGWELAAKAIHQFEADKKYSLRDLMAQFNDKTKLYYGLVDPNWVFSAPSHLCLAQGYGPKIIFEQNLGGTDGNGDGDFNDPVDTQPERLVTRAQYCADIQTCIDRNDDGSCRYFGYCTEERRVWDLNGASCNEAFNTCQTYQRSDGYIASYLANSLEYNGCGIDNAGCLWYCQEYNGTSDLWTCLNEEERVLKPCVQVGGCNLTAACTMAQDEDFCSDVGSQVNLYLDTLCGPGSQFWNDATATCDVSTSCTIPEGGVSCQTNSCSNLANLLPNADFETAGTGTNFLAQDWETNAPSYFERVSGAAERTHSGTHSIRFFSFGGSIAPGAAILNSDPDKLFLQPSTNYTFSAWVFNSLNAGTISYTIEQSGTPLILPVSLGNLLKNQWVQVAIPFTTGSSGNDINVRFSVAGDQVNGVVWFDDFRISESCIANSVELTLVGSIDKDESKIHLDRDVVSCDPSSAGCSQFIRTAPNLGTNLVANGSFEIWPFPNTFPPGLIAGDQVDPNKKIERSDDAQSGVFSAKLTNGGAPTGHRDFRTEPIAGVRPDKIYRISFWAKTDVVDPNSHYYTGVIADDGTGTLIHKQLQFNEVANLPLTTTWQKFTMDRYIADNGVNNFQFTINNASTITTSSIFIDELQIEEVSLTDSSATAYKEYGSANVAYIKKAPDYLNCSGDPFKDLPECNNYAFVCQEAEVGCEAYTPVNGGSAIPGVVAITDYCPAECVGYAAYKQSKTSFEDQETLSYFIPKTAKQCTAAAAGCDEFTNLDEVAAGGEGKAYYQYLRQCELPENASCKNFYSWQGSDESGFQLKVTSLSSVATAPAEALLDRSDWPEAWCNDTSDGVGGLPKCCDSAEDVLVNPFCRELLDLSGTVYYRIIDNTISCSEDCHPFRKTRLGEADGVASANCTNTNGEFTGGSCVYKAVPGQGIQCSPSFAGCREYRGNTGANVFTVISENFESATETGWRYGSISSEALSVGGHSMKSVDNAGQQRIVSSFGDLGQVCTSALTPCTSPGQVDCWDLALNGCVADDVADPAEVCLVEPGDQYCSIVNNILTPKKTYTLSFWAKSDEVVVSDLTVDLVSSTNPQLIIDKVTLVPEWNYFKVGPFDYAEEFAADSIRLRFIAPTTPATPPGLDYTFYVDNINLQEVNGYVYAIRNSWNTPVSCDTNPFTIPPSPAPLFMLGCEQYYDSFSRVHNLKSFDHLCREQAVGCEALLDTHNSSNPFAETFNINDPLSDMKVSADSLTYLTNRSEFRCDALSKGCESVGLPQINIDNEVVSHLTTYLINDPDRYADILCENEEVFCEEYQVENGFVYFKDPGLRTCDYKLITGTSDYGWYKRGSVSAEPDCPVSQPAIGAVHPTTFAGTCPAEYDSCTEFIDPTNAVGKARSSNSNFDIDIDGNGAPDNWNPRTVGSTSIITQPISLQANKSYTLSFTGKAESLRSASLGGILDFDILNCENIQSFDQSMNIGKSCFSNADNQIKLPRQTCETNADCGAGFYCNDTATLPKLSYASDKRLDPFDPGFVTGVNVEVAGFPAYPQYSGRFSVPDNETCTLAISIGTATPSTIYNTTNELVTQAIVRDTGVYYVLENTVDKLSCGGLVDPLGGCVMFNDRSGVNYKLGENDSTYLQFDADISGPGVNSAIPVAQCSGNCDASSVLRVQPDRVCEEWLYCNSFALVPDSNGIPTRYCTNLGQCSEINPDGSCKTPELVNALSSRDASVSDREKIKNLSGYANPGLEFDPTLLADHGVTGVSPVVEGYFPYAEMSQRGSNGRVANGDFEFTFGEGSEPVGWTSVSTGFNGICTNGIGLSAGSEAIEENNRGFCDDNNDCGAGNRCVLADIVPVKYFDHKFTIERDFKNSISGPGYLRVNSFYEAQSEEIDVQEGNEYILTAKINTLSLEYPDPNPSDGVVPARAEILLKPINQNGAQVLSGPPPGCTQTSSGFDINDQWWECPGLTVGQGLPWQDVSVSIIMPIGATKLLIKLRNALDQSVDPNCFGQERHDLTSSCELGGLSLFDAVSLKSVLEVNDSNTNSNFVQRSCRIYPTSDALSCNFADENTFFFGKEGYCVTADPNNPQQCLQWWPVDQISGETLDEVVSEYNDRYPLYYCTDIASTSINLGNGGSLVDFGGAAEDFLPEFFTDQGVGVSFSKFNIPSGYETLIRYPFVEQFTFKANAIFGGAGSGGGGAGIVIPRLYKINYDQATRDWDKAGFIAFGVDVLGILSLLFGGGALPIGGYVAWFIDLAPFSPTGEGWDLAVNPVLGLIADAIVGGQIFGLEQHPYITLGPIVGVALVTDTDADFAQFGEDPVPELDGDIIGIKWFMKPIDVSAGSGIGGLLGSLWNGDASIGTFTNVNMSLFGEYQVNFCSELTEVVNSSGDNRSYANRIQNGTGYVLFDSISRASLTSGAASQPPIKFCEGTVTYCETNNDCEIFDPPVSCITIEFRVCAGTAVACEINANCTALGFSGPCVAATNPPAQGEVNINVEYIYFNPFDYDAFLDDVNNYNSSDYSPFGSLVQPADNQYPPSWDAKAGDSTQQPLLFEPPRTSFEEPFQPRMGELHTPNSLQRIFAKNYKYWHWEWKPNKPPGKSDIEWGGFYSEGPQLGDPDADTPISASGSTSWDISSSSGQCNGNNRANGLEPCFVRPVIDPNLIKLNDVNVAKAPNVVIRGAGAARLDFNLVVNSDQLPLTSYTIDWGDAKSTGVSGVVLRGRSNEENPFTLFHTYDYWDMVRSCNSLKASGDPSNDCNNSSDRLWCDPAANTCTAKLGLKAKDNWGVETGSVSNPWVASPVTVIVTKP